MPTSAGCAGRRARLRGSLTDDCETLVLHSPEALALLSGFRASPFTFRSNEAGAFLILRRDRAVLVGDNLLRPDLDRAHVDEVVGPTWYEGRTSAEERRGRLVRAARDVLGTSIRGPIGIELGSVPAGLVESLGGMRTTDLGPALRELRRSKDPDEIDAIRRALNAADVAHRAVARTLRPGMTELEAFLIVQEVAQRAVGEPVVVYGDFVSGPRCAERGGPPTERAIRPGDAVLLDFSVVIDGYRGDTARTFVVEGRPDDELMQFHEVSLAALAAAEARLRPGVSCREIDAAIREVYAAHGLADRNSGHSGHGLGLGHPEPPFLVADSSEVLRSGDVVAVEPGLYRPGGPGVRVEHNYRITDAGHERLSRHDLGLTPSG